MIYFISDFHLEVKKTAISWEREKIIINFLKEIENTATEVFLLGDIFDFWFEYKTVIPKGYIRFLGQLARMADNGIKLHYFVGNHDMWMRDYFTKELNIKIYYKPTEMKLGNKIFLIGHGDGLGPKTFIYRILKFCLFKNPIAYKFCLSFLPSDIFMSFGRIWSEYSRRKSNVRFEKYLGDEQESLFQYCFKKLSLKQIDFFIFGHRHLPLKKQLSATSYYFNTGDWLKYNSYLVYNFDTLELKYF